MTEKEIMIEKMYEKYGAWLLPVDQAAKEWGMSKSAVNKLFGGANAIPEKIIKSRRIIPLWTMVGKRRRWSLTNIADWVLNTQYA